MATSTGQSVNIEHVVKNSIFLKLFSLKPLKHFTAILKIVEMTLLKYLTTGGKSFPKTMHLVTNAMQQVNYFTCN
jgi:hypothetical protein